MGFINKDILTIAFHKPFPTDTVEGRSMERRRRIVLTSFTALIGKVLHVALPLITIKITYSYLGVEVYGLWSAVTTFFALFAFSDLGLGNGLQTIQYLSCSLACLFFITHCFFVIIQIHRLV